MSTLDKQIKEQHDKLRDLEKTRQQVYATIRNLEAQKRKENAAKAVERGLQRKAAKEAMLGKVEVGDVVKITGVRTTVKPHDKKYLPGAYRLVVAVGKDSISGLHVKITKDGHITDGEYITTHGFDKIIAVTPYKRDLHPSYAAGIIL